MYREVTDKQQEGVLFTILRLDTVGFKLLFMALWVSNHFSALLGREPISVQIQAE